MKKYLRKISALFISLVMVLSVCASVFAAEDIIGDSDDTGTITVKNVDYEDSVTVKAYPIVKADYDEKNKNFTGYSTVGSYKIQDISHPKVSELNEIADTIKKDSTQEIILKYNKADQTYTAEVSVGSYLILVEGSESVSYNVAVASVYYVNENGQNVLHEGVTDMHIRDGVAWIKKSNQPSLEKKIIEDSTEKKGNSVNIGDIVNYKVTIKPIPAYEGNHPVLKVEDTLSTGLTYVDDDKNPLKVTINRKTLNEGTDYTLEVIGQKITVNFVVNGNYTLNKYEGQEAVISYAARLNDKAGINEAGNNNDAKLTYTKDSKVTGKDENIEKKTYTYTFDIDGTASGSLTKNILTKYGEEKGEKQEKLPLKDAEFTLYKDAGCTEIYSNPVFSGIVKSDKDGQLTMTGLAAGTYYLKETKAPEDYTLNTHVFEIVITAKYKEDDGQLEKWTVTIDDQATNTFVVTNNGVTTNAKDEINGKVEETGIQNTKLSELPSTGGTGTYIFTVLGVMVMAGVAGMFLISRRKENE